MKKIILIMFLLCSSVVLGKSLYVSVDDANCNDANTYANNSETYPFCSLDRATNVITTGGDIVYVKDGIYRHEHKFHDLTLTDSVTFQPYPGHNPILCRTVTASQDYTWVNLSNSTDNMWGIYADYSTTYVYMFQNVSDGVYKSYYHFQQPTSSVADWNSSGIKDSYIYDDTNHVFYANFEDMTLNPNNEDFYIHRFSQPIAIYNMDGAETILSNFTVCGATRGIYVYDSSNVTLEYNTVISGKFGIDSRRNDNTLIYRNNIYMNHTDLWTWDNMKNDNGAYMETTGIWLQDGNENYNVTDNYILGSFNGITAYTTSKDDFKDLQIQYNEINRVRDDAIELEDYGNYYSIKYNDIYNAFYGLSLAPFNSTQGQSEIKYNIIRADTTYRYDDTNNYTGGCFKVASENNQTTNIYIHHNTCIGRGKYTTAPKNSTWQNVTVKDNIFYGDNDYAFHYTGRAVDGVLLDYNLYYRADNGNLFRYYDSDTDDTVYTSLSAALLATGSSFDANSLNINPMFYDTETYTPYADSSVCTADSNGGYIGAVSCSGIYYSSSIEITDNGQEGLLQISGFLWIIGLIIVTGIIIAALTRGEFQGEDLLKNVLVLGISALIIVVMTIIISSM